MPVDIPRSEFEALVERALDEIPDEIARHVHNLVVLVEDDTPPDDPDLLGRYDGVALTERETWQPGGLPDQILLFRRPLQAMCHSLEELEHEVRITVVHEVAHHFGIEEGRLHELGYG